MDEPNLSWSANSLQSPWTMRPAVIKIEGCKAYGVPPEPEITPEMVDAGVQELLGHFDGIIPETTPYSNGVAVEAIFSAMIAARAT